MRRFMVEMPSGVRYWTVLDDGFVPMPDADAFLRHLRFGRDAAPSEDEIKKVRHLIHRVEEHLDELTDDDRTQILEATAMLRRTRPAVALGMPTVRTSA